MRAVVHCPIKYLEWAKSCGVHGLIGSKKAKILKQWCSTLTLLICSLLLAQLIFNGMISGSKCQDSNSFPNCLNKSNFARQHMI